MTDFPLPRRDLEIKLCKCGLLAVILIRRVLFKPVFLQDQGISLKCQLLLNCWHCYVGSISMKDFTLPSRDWRYNLQMWITGRDYHPHVPFQASVLHDQAILLKSVPTQL